MFTKQQVQGLVSAGAALIAREWYRSAASTCEKSFLLGVAFVPQWVHNGYMDSTREQQGGTTMTSAQICRNCGELFPYDYCPSCAAENAGDDEHSASRRLDVLQREAPHLIDNAPLNPRRDFHGASPIEDTHGHVIVSSSGGFVAGPYADRNFARTIIRMFAPDQGFEIEWRRIDGMA